jgi:site-specific DNA-methyltransferase (adenine-specific)
MKSEVFNMDCVEAMKGYPDNYFDLAIVDPPYGIGMDGGKIGKGIDFNTKNWDSAIPIAEYWEQLFRVSKNQIVWGGNYMTEYLKPTSAWVYWDKMQDGFGKTFSSGELAWTSYKNPMKQIRYKYQGNYIGFENSITTKSSNHEMLKIHPTQKPVALYRWLLQNYAKEGDKILDTHLGSGSSRVAADMEGYNFTGYELDKDYFDASVKRFNDYKQQIKLL